MSGAIATLLIGLGTFLVTRIDPKSWLYSADVITLLIGIVLVYGLPNWQGQ
jgi:hypothetical protein